ncbi:phosphate/phosphite/phosphonate ABC transporter substrate-binding protein [Caulobacter sp. NIBR2454]|uniref:phosphate/phosphite/phosphonate ABC transporter substrate-binding protein n=1 Tax=Caulobacter sp. NIBR2454 TaxID=3015996 RepID=UPI0022B701BD|nr:phosphate/phosphite/phosphonate ABC transporter substrate-binding protein [Caulobacter sp. NIBR2454]
MIRRSILAGAALAAMIGLSGCGKPDPGAGGPTTVNFSILAVENAQGLQTEWGPILADMEKATGYKIKPFFQSNYTSLIEAMRFKQTDVAWFSNQSGLEAVRRSNGEVFARTFDPSGADGYKSVLIVPASSKTTLEDVLKCDKTLDFGIGDAKSTSGTLAPMTYLFSPQAIKPERCFKTVRAANHQANLFAVAKGVLDVATNNSTSIRLNRERGESAANQIRVIWESPKLPEDPIVWRKDLDPAVKEKVRQFMLTYGKGEGPDAERQRANLRKLSIGGFVPADNTHLIPVREMEATGALAVAENEKDAAKIAEAKKALDAVRAERAALEAKTGKAAE